MNVRLIKSNAFIQIQWNYRFSYSLYNWLIAEAGSNSFGKFGRTAVTPHVIYLNTHGAKNPGPGRPWHILAANSCPILLLLPSAIVNIPQNGAQPITSSPVK